MIKTLKNAFSSKAKKEATIIKTANAIRARNGRAEISTLEDAVSTVIYNTTLVTKHATYQDDVAAGKACRPSEHLLPSVLLGMILTQKMWIAFEENFDGGRVASYVALGHCLEDDPTKDNMAVFAEGAAKYNPVLEALGLEDGKFHEMLATLIENTDSDAVAQTFMPVYASIREHEKAIPAS